MSIGGVVGGLIAVVAGLFGTWTAWLTWQGRELRSVGEGLADPRTRKAHTLFGGRTLYQTSWGAGAGLFAGGPGIVIIGLGLAARSSMETDTDPWWWGAASSIGLALVMVGVVYLFTYQWVGMPDALRPPAQRGQPRIGRVDDDGRQHPLDRLLATSGPVDLGPDPTSPPWSRRDPEWVGSPRRPRPRIDSDGSSL